MADPSIEKEVISKKLGFSCFNSARAQKYIIIDISMTNKKIGQNSLNASIISNKRKLVELKDVSMIASKNVIIFLHKILN
jgi:hypothetical protein